MVYDKNIPERTIPPSQACSKMLNNFTEISNALEQNHSKFNTTNQGKHEFLQMPVQDSAPETSTNEVGLYSKTSELSGNPELFYREQASGTETEFTSSLQDETGWTRLPSGILLKWGLGAGRSYVTSRFLLKVSESEFTVKSFNISSNFEDKVVFPTGSTIPSFTKIFSVQFTSFAKNFYYLAIGV